MAASLVPNYTTNENDNETSESDDGEPTIDHAAMMKPLNASTLVGSMDLAPAVVSKSEIGGTMHVDPTTKQLHYNPKYDQLFKPMAGPVNPYKSASQRVKKNMLTGFVEAAHINPFHFEREIRTFDTHGYARDPSAETSQLYVGDVKKAEANLGVGVFDSKKTGGEKRRRACNFDSSDVDGYTGPWGGYEVEERVSKPDADTQMVMDEFMRKKRKHSKANKKAVAEAANIIEETTTLHFNFPIGAFLDVMNRTPGSLHEWWWTIVKETVDYLGRSWMCPPQDAGVNLRADYVPDRCYLPKKQVHTYRGHSKGVNCIRWFPKSAHLLLSCSMDCKIKLWEVYNKRSAVRTYVGHKMPVRDICFGYSGSEFLSASFDRFIKLWDTETGKCKQRFQSGQIPFCIKFNPDEDKQHFFLSGMQNKKILQWDTRSGEIVQEYDRHLGPVNNITFFDKNRRFCSTSDDKSIRIWEWEIPVDTKLIQNSGLHSIPTMTKSPDERWVVGQAMDNRIVLFQLIDDKLRFARKKAFRGHIVAGYSCTIDFSPDMSYLISGDAEGKIFIWDWKTHKIVARWKAHETTCIGSLWHPHEKSKMITCGWDNLIKMWM